jgi:hypothetical protein
MYQAETETTRLPFLPFSAASGGGKWEEREEPFVGGLVVAFQSSARRDKPWDKPGGDSSRDRAIAFSGAWGKTGAVARCNDADLGFVYFNAFDEET